MRPITTLAIQPGIRTPCPDVQGSDGWAVLYNESVLNVQVETGLGVKTLPAWTGDKFKLHGPAQAGQLAVTGSVLVGQSNPPSSSITGDLYNDVEGEPHGIFPVALSRQVSVGNAQPLSTSATAVINDGNAAATQILEATPLDQSPTHAWNFANDGSGQLQILSAGVQRNVLQTTRGNSGAGKAAIVLGDAGDTSILTVNGSIANATNATNASKVAGGAFHPGNVDAYGFPNNAADGSVRWRSTTTFNGTGAGTYSHSFASLTGAGTPNYIGITANEANSTQTVGVDSVGATTVHVNMPNAWPFLGLAAET